MSGPKRSLSSESVILELKGVAGQATDTRYFSSSRIMSYQDTQLLRDRIESVDFTVNTKVSAYDSASKILKFKVKTTRKDGKVDLHSLAFPELKEELDYVVESNSGKIIQEGAYSPQSIFFIPSIPMPQEPVGVGDTWTMDHIWYSAAENIPLKLEIVGIFKDLVTCDGGRRCADIEVSGRVGLIVPATTQGSRFESRLWGRMLFSIERGDIVWSEMRSAEEMMIPGERVHTISCMVSEMHISKEFKSKFECDPKVIPTSSTPRSL